MIPQTTTALVPTTDHLTHTFCPYCYPVERLADGAMVMSGCGQLRPYHGGGAVHETADEITCPACRAFAEYIAAELCCYRLCP